MRPQRSERVLTPYGRAISPRMARSSHPTPAFASTTRTPSGLARPQKRGAPRRGAASDWAQVRVATFGGGRSKRFAGKALALMPHWKECSE